MPSTPIVSIAEALKRVSSESRNVAGERSEKVMRLEKELSALERARTNILMDRIPNDLATELCLQKQRYTTLNQKLAV